MRIPDELQERNRVRHDEAGRSLTRAGARRAAGELEAAVLAVLQAAGSVLTPGQVRERLLRRMLDAYPGAGG